MTSTRELDLVELVSPDGTVEGSATVLDAHTAPGFLHRAFSVLLFDPRGYTLLQQRAVVKTRFPLRWANSCCGHPAPGQPVTEAATQRLVDELGVHGIDLVDTGVYTYRAEDATTGRVEHEYDHVLVGRVPVGFTVEPDDREVAAVRWADPADLASIAASIDYAPWLAGVLSVARAANLSP